MGVLLAPSALASAQLGSRVLREGMRGSDVLSLQRLLNKIGLGAPSNGTFGPSTESVVLSFENKYGLKANGRFDKADVAELRRVVRLQAPTGGLPMGAPQAPVSSTSPPQLRPGATGHWVAVLQQELTYAGYATNVDGQYGPATARSVDAFKSAHALALNGSFGRQAWTALQAAIGAMESSVPVSAAVLNTNGTVTAPANAPTVVKNVIAAANQIAFTPYIYGGGHASFIDSGYDCSGSVSYALRGGGLILAPEDSGELESYGLPGAGQWITIYANAGHAYMWIAGLWFDTAAQSSTNGHDRWSATRISPLSGYVVRHPVGE